MKTNDESRAEGDGSFSDNESAMREPDGIDRLVDMSLDAGKPLISSRDPDTGWKCHNPDCGGWRSWHGKPTETCPGSWLFNRDGTRREF